MGQCTVAEELNGPTYNAEVVGHAGDEVADAGGRRLRVELNGLGPRGGRRWRQRRRGRRELRREKIRCRGG